jgi:hypothetical protein
MALNACGTFEILGAKRNKPLVGASCGKSRHRPLSASYATYPLKLVVNKGTTMDLFNNPVGYLTSPVVFQAKALQNHIFSGSCSET